MKKSISMILLNALRMRRIDVQGEDLMETGPFADVEYLVPNMVCEGCALKRSPQR